MNKNELYHYGIKGMKWGVRRYQNEDGSLTEKGKKRYRSASEYERDLLFDSTMANYYDTAYADHRHAAESYRAQTKRYPSKNIFVSIGRRYAQKSMDKKVSKLKYESEKYTNNVKRWMDEISKAGYSMTVEPSAATFRMGANNYGTYTVSRDRYHVREK